MTLAEGAANAKQAQEFVLLYPVPILGPLHTTKALKLLAHLLDAVRLHGSILNGDTSLNEQEHKKDKRHYVRTDKGTWSFLRQVVRHANGSRGVLRLNKEADAVRSAPCAGPGDDEDVSSDGASDGNEAEDKGPGAPEAGAGAEVADAAATAAPHRIANAPSNDLAAQLARATPKYRTTSWYDFLAFRCESDDAGTPERYGQVRTLLSMEDGDVAVVAELVPTGEDDGPLTSL
eukprot:contig_7047_g1631